MTNRRSFEDVSKYLVADEVVSEAIRKAFGDRADAIIEAIASGAPSECDTSDLLYDTLHNEHRTYSRFTAHGSYGEYNFEIFGLGGVYFYWAPDFGKTGYFLSVDDAADHLTSQGADSLDGSSREDLIPAFVNKALMASIDAANAAVRSVKADDNLRKALLLLSMDESPADVDLWRTLLAGPPIQDSAVCASLLERWFSSGLDLASRISHGSERLNRLALGTGISVFLDLLGRGQGAVLSRIQNCAHSERDALISQLSEARGVARMGLAQALNAARENVKQVDHLINAVQGPSSSSALAPETLQAYGETEYRVHDPDGFTLRISEPSAALSALHQRYKVSCSAFITACNPLGECLDAEGNTRLHEALRLALSEGCLVFKEGIGQHPSNAWPGEASFLILGLALDDAREAGERWAQNAILWSGEDAVPQLIVLR